MYFHKRTDRQTNRQTDNQELNVGFPFGTCHEDISAVLETMFPPPPEDIELSNEQKKLIDGVIGYFGEDCCTTSRTSHFETITSCENDGPALRAFLRTTNDDSLTVFLNDLAMEENNLQLNCHTSNEIVQQGFALSFATCEVQVMGYLSSV